MDTSPISRKEEGGSNRARAQDSSQMETSPFSREGERRGINNRAVSDSRVLVDL